MVQFGQAIFSCSKQVALSAAEALDSLDGIVTGPPAAAIVRTATMAWCRNTSPPFGYIFDEASAAAADGTIVVIPRDRNPFQTGRWLLFSGGSSFFSSIIVTFDYLATPQFRVIFEAGTLLPAGPGQRTLALPPAPVKDEEYYVHDSTGTASPATPIVVAGNSKLIDGTSTKTIATAYGTLHVKYDGAEWRVL